MNDLLWEDLYGQFSDCCKCYPRNKKKHAVMVEADNHDSNPNCFHLMTGFRFNFRNLEHVSLFIVGPFYRKFTTM
jgi:hypothetical protein